MISARDYHNAHTWLSTCARPLLITHRRPDGDALGALTALDLALRGRGHTPLATLYEPWPRRYALLQDATQWNCWDQQRSELIKACDAVVILDTCAASQLEPIADWLPMAPRTLVIDHHPTGDPIATRPNDLRLIDDTAGAACLILTEWMQANSVPLTPTIATALFTGLATDCGWFRFPSTDTRALRAAARLTAAGAVPSQIYRAVCEQDPPARLRLIGRMLQTLELHANDRLGVMKLRQADFDAAGATRDMTEDLVNEASRLGCTEATIMFTEESDGGVRVNLRSKQTLDVSALAQRFNGGGHARASGARPDGPWDEVVPRVIAAAIEALDDQGPPAP